MANNVSRLLIETIVKKALREIQDSPERSIRNLVDLAAHFSVSRFQQRFFEVAQTMLENRNSPYYDLVTDIVSHVDCERLLRFGINVGYNSCTVGAKRLRAVESEEGYNIPWSVVLRLEGQKFLANQERYHSVISQGEELGVYTWMLFVKGQLEEFLSLAQDHPDSAFILFCESGEITMPFLECVSELNNIMLVIRYDEETCEEVSEVCALLRDMELLYSLYYVYGDKDLEYITAGELFSNTEQLHPTFSAVLSARDTSDEVKEEVYEYVKQARGEQLFQTIVWELEWDNIYVDSVISNDACSAGFDSDGQLCTLYEHKTEKCFDLFRNDLAQIFKRAFPKKGPGESMT